MGECPCYMHLFPPDELLPSQKSSKNNCQVTDSVDKKVTPTPPVIDSPVASSPNPVETQENNSLSLQEQNSTTMKVSRPLASCYTYALGNSLYVPLTSR